MKLSTQLLIAPLVTAVVAISSVTAYALINRQEVEVGKVADAVAAGNLQLVHRAEAQLSQVRGEVFRTLALMSSLDEAAVKKTRADLLREVETVGSLLSKAKANSAGDAEIVQLSSQAEPLLAQYAKQCDKAIDLSGMDPNVGIGAMRAADDTYAKLNKDLGAIGVRSQAMLDLRDKASASRMLLLSLLLVGFTMAASAGALFFSWRTQRHIVADVSNAVDLSRAVAEGRLDVQAQSERSDEIGDLVRALGEMVQRLRGSMQTVRQATDSIGTAAREIAAGNADLSQRTEQAAGSLQQTASSTEELTATVRQTADSARTASQLAASASEVALRGGSVVAQVVVTMNEINTSSRKIADITSVIDGIAFQTNILALNAAVEAARAGEQGRGFAVVASEVRSLAQRSAAAAKEIKSLIGDSVDRVEAGSRLVGSAGSTMSEIVDSVRRVADIIGEISAAASEQSAGLCQVNNAVTSLDQATQQNSALVEESAAAAESLREQANRLLKVVASFQLGAEAPESGSVSPAPAAQTQDALKRKRARSAALTPALPSAAPAPAPKSVAVFPRSSRAAPSALSKPVAFAGTAATVAVIASAAASTDGTWESF